MSGYVSQCVQCGQSDDHPKVIAATLAGQSVILHHDCLPHDLREQLVQNDQAKAVIEACEGGLKGDKLREQIAAIHAEGGPQDAAPLDKEVK